ncbi:MAG: Type IV secretion system protein VirB11 [Legionellaceae bacterium]
MTIETAALNEYLKPLRVLLDDNTLNEIIINEPSVVWIEREGRFDSIQMDALNERHLMGLANLLARFSHQRLSEKEPLLSGVLPSGHRVQLVLPPATEKGRIVICIRKQTIKATTLKDYADRGAFLRTKPCYLPQKNPLSLAPDTEEERALQAAFSKGDFLAFLTQAILMKKTIGTSGATSTGKTTFLNACLQKVPLNEHIVTLEDVSELMPTQPLHTPLFTSKGGQSSANISMQDLVQASLRLRPDRIIMGEIRGAEAIDFMNAAATGHDGSLFSVHAGTIPQAFMRLVHMVKLTGTNLSREDILNDLLMTVDIVVQLKRRWDGEKLIREISDIYYVHAKT